MALAEARGQGATLLEELRRGNDPKRKIMNPTLRWALGEYPDRAREDLRPTSVKAYRQIERWLEHWMDLPLREITSDMVEARHRSIADAIGKDVRRYSGTSTANAAMRILRIVWNFAAERIPDLPPNPVRRLKRQWFSEPRRTGMVATADLPKFYAALQSLQNKIAADYLTLLLPFATCGGLFSVRYLPQQRRGIYRLCDLIPVVRDYYSDPRRRGEL